MSIEEELVRAFVVPQKKRRYVELVKTKKGREKFVSELAHFNGFDARFVRRINPARHAPALIHNELRLLGAPSRCFVISESAALDAKEMDLSAALDAVVGSGLASLLSCVPGALAFYEGEEPGERFILRRTRRT